MAAKITEVVGEGNPDAVIAITIVLFSLSAMMTGLVFYLMGRFKVGYMVGFFPRYILIGCIGGVGWFLVITGFELSARLNGSLQYDLDTLKQLIDMNQSFAGRLVPKVWELPSIRIELEHATIYYYK